MTCVELMQETGPDAGGQEGPKSRLRIVWIATGTVSVGLGVAGLVLPLLPTTPFVILAAWCFARSSPRLRQKLVEHPLLGPSLRNWEQERAIARRAKVLASVLMALLLALSVAMRFPLWIVALQALAAVGVMLFLWTRPDPRPAE